jgi:hypothetical protein
MKKVLDYCHIPGKISSAIHNFYPRLVTNSSAIRRRDPSLPLFFPPKPLSERAPDGLPKGYSARPFLCPPSHTVVFAEAEH